MKEVVVTRPRSDVTTILRGFTSADQYKVVTRPRSDVTTIIEPRRFIMSYSVVTRPRSDVTTIIAGFCASASLKL